MSQKQFIKAISLIVFLSFLGSISAAAASAIAVNPEDHGSKYADIPRFYYLSRSNSNPIPIVAEDQFLNPDADSTDSATMDGFEKCKKTQINQIQLALDTFDQKILDELFVNQSGALNILFEGFFGGQVFNLNLNLNNPHGNTQEGTIEDTQVSFTYFYQRYWKSFEGTFKCQTTSSDTIIQTLKMKHDSLLNKNH